jgi:hypothetical protein
MTMARGTAARTADNGTACAYVYGIVPSDVEVTQGARGVGDPPARVRLVCTGSVGALVSEIDPAGSLGRPADLLAHQHLLDAAAACTPVLPLRFGMVLADSRTVQDELLVPHEPEFAAALGDLDGHAQFVVKGRYDEEPLLRTVLARHREAIRLREAIIAAGGPAGARSASIQLGEIVSAAIREQRHADTAALAQCLDPCCVTGSVRAPTHELDAVHLAVLAPSGRRRDVEAAVAGMARAWAGRVGLRLLGPMAPYDFVTATSWGG